MAYAEVPFRNAYKFSHDGDIAITGAVGWVFVRNKNARGVSVFRLDNVYYGGIRFTGDNEYLVCPPYANLNGTQPSDSTSAHDYWEAVQLLRENGFDKSLGNSHHPYVFHQIFSDQKGLPFSSEVIVYER